MCRNPKTLKVIQINLNRCEAAALALQKVMIDLRIDIALIQEPFYYNNIQVVPYVPRGFKVMHSMTESCGGALVLARSNLEDLTKLVSEHTSTGISFKWAGKSMYAASIYTRPVAKISAADLTHNFIARNHQIDISRTVIGIDANAHSPMWYSTSTKAARAGDELVAMANTAGLNIINEPIDRETLLVPTQFIDVTLAGDIVHKQLLCWNFLDIHSASDHPYIYMEIRGGDTKQKKKHHQARLPAEDDTNLNTLLVTVSRAMTAHQPQLTTTTDIDNEVDWLCTLITESTRSSAKQNQKPLFKQMTWWNRELYALRNALRTAAKKYSKNPSQETREEAQLHKRIFQRRVRETRIAAVTAIRTEFSNRDPFGALRVLNRSKIPTIDKLQYNGSTTSDPSEIAKVLGDHFFNTVEKPLTPGQQTTVVSARALVSRRSPSPHEPITEQETVEALNKIIKRKSAGLDGVQGWQLLVLKHPMKKALTEIFNACCAMNHFPDSWKIGRIVFLLKPGRDSQLAASYRPISILPILGKTFERIIKVRLMHHAITESWFAKSQHGFMANRSTITAAYELTSEIKTGFNNKWDTLACLIDIQGAFDNAWHPAIIQELGKNNCPPYLIKLLANFLADRKAVIRQSETNYPFSLSKGCPQGSVLSPILWNLLLNSALKKIENKKDRSLRRVKCLAYADDLVLFAKTKSGKSDNSEKTRVKLQSSIYSFASWCSANRLDIAPKKTELILFSKKRKPSYDTGITVIVNGLTVKQCDEVRYLGLTMDRGLKWTAHILKACSKAVKVGEIVNRISRSSWGADRHTLNLLYRTVVMPTLTYGCAIWADGMSNKVNCRKLLSTQRSMALATIHGYHSISTEATFILANWLPLDLEIMLIAAKFGLETLIKNEQSSPNQPSNNIKPQPPPYISKPALDLLTSVGVTSTQYPNLIVTNSPSCIPTSSILRRIASPVKNLPPWDTKKSLLKADFSGKWIPSLHPANQNAVYIYTDGSRFPGRVGAGTLLCTADASDIESREGLDPHSTVFEAEVAAILTALKMITSNSNLTWKEAYIFSDSQAALKAIGSTDAHYPMVNSIQELLLAVTPDRTVTLTWVKAHCGTAGNERADQLAKEASELKPQGKSTYTINEIIRRGRTWAYQTWNSNWKSSSKGRWTFKLIPDINIAKQLGARKLSYEMCQVVSGHAGLNGYLEKRRVLTSAQCACNMNKETMEHFLFLCPLHHVHRISFHNVCISKTGRWPPPLASIIPEQAVWYALSDFVRKTGRLQHGGKPGRNKTSESDAIQQHLPMPQ